MDALQGIVAFNDSRNLTNFDPINEYRMIEEELQEFIFAADNNNEYETVDALCDIIVVAAGGLHKLGYSPEDALAETVKEISSRKGAINPATGKWEKDVNQDPTTLYKAVYTNLDGVKAGT